MSPEGYNIVMIALTWQSWAVVATVAAAVVYLGWYAWRSLRRRGNGLGCCAAGCGAALSEPADARLRTEAQPREGARPPATAGSTTFIPLENMVDLARRHKQQQHQPAPTE